MGENDNNIAKVNDASSTGRNGASHEAYERSCIALAIKDTIEQLKTLKRDNELAVATQLLADFNEEKIGLADAERVHTRLQKVIQDSRISKQSIMTSEAMVRLVASILAVVSSAIVLYMALAPKPQPAEKKETVAAKTADTAAGSTSDTTASQAQQAPEKDVTADRSTTDWQYLPVSKLKDVRSISDSTHTDFHLVNNTDSKIKLLWINYDGKTEVMGEIEPTQSQDEGTFMSHAWLVVDKNNKPLMLFVAGKKQAENISVTQK